MDQAWWVYTLVAFVCLVMYLSVKVLEHKILKDSDIDLSVVSFALGFIGFFAALKAADALNIFK